MPRMRSLGLGVLLSIVLALLGIAPATAAQQLPPDFGSDPGPSNGFSGLFVLALLVGVGISIWKVTTARRMARGSGMSETDATAMTLLTDDGLEATYLASNLRGQAAPPPVAPPLTSSVADRLRQLTELRDRGLITPEEYDARRTAIIDSV